MLAGSGTRFPRAEAFTPSPPAPLPGFAGERGTRGTRVQGGWFPDRPAVLIINGMTDRPAPPDWRPLALTLAVVAAAYAVAYRLMPFDMRGFFLWPFGGWALYAGARLTLRVAVPLVLGGFFLSELILHKGFSMPPNTIFYLCLGASMFLGRLLLAHSQALWRIVAGGVASYAFFFLVSNFAAWLGPSLPEYKPYTFQTLLLAYEKGLEFLRWQPGQIYGLGDVGFSLVLFGAHAMLAREYFPAERVVPEAAR